MNIVILGAGEIGRYLAIRLSEQGHEVGVIEQEEALTSQLSQLVDARVVHGDGTLAQTLAEARVAQCDLFVASTTSNNTNLVAAALARQVGATRTICRVEPRVEQDQLFVNRRQLFQVDHLFSSERLTVIELAKAIRNPESLLVEDLAQGRIELQQVKVSGRSPIVGKSLREAGLPGHLRVGTITRGDTHLVPTAEDQLLAGDLVTLFGSPKSVQEFARTLGKGVASVEEGNVVILGGGQYGSELARVLQASKLRIRIFEKNPARCQELMQAFGREATIINADATDLAALKEEQVGEADFFVATLADDAANVMACLQASDLGASHSLTLLHRADFAAAIHRFRHQVGIDGAVSPREATLKNLLRFLTADRYHILRRLEAGEVIESSVAEKSVLVGKRVAEIAWPEGSVLVGHIHGIHAEVPSADSVLNAGDNIIAMVAHAAKRKYIKLLGK
jgi:trk system potassium uptake protein TrkA